jgi:hypothetical protein
MKQCPATSQQDLAGLYSSRLVTISTGFALLRRAGIHEINQVMAAEPSL